MEVKIPRLNVALPSEVVTGAISGAFVQLGFEKPKKKQSWSLSYLHVDLRR